MSKKPKSSVFKEVGGDVARELGMFGSATAREACGVIGILPMNPASNIGRWKSPKRRHRHAYGQRRR